MIPRTLVNNWLSITINEEDSFSVALKIMSIGGYQLCLVRKSDGKLAGMVTDSDIRKALLRGITLETKVSNVMNKYPLVVSPDLGEAEAHQLMLINHFFHIPIVNSYGKLVGLHVAHQLRSAPNLSETLVIMAGGKGKRLMPLTQNIPKPMLPVRGKPILEHIIEKAKRDGFQKIIISVNYLAKNIISHFGSGEDHGISIDYIKENKPLGTAGALSMLPENIRNNNIVVTNGDVITDVAYSDLLNPVKTESANGVMAVRLQEWQNPFGVVNSEGSKLLSIEEKPINRHQVNAGMYSLDPELINLLIPEKYCDMTDLFSLGLQKGLKLNIFPIHESWLDIGRMEDYRAADNLIP